MVSGCARSLTAFALTMLLPAVGALVYGALWQTWASIPAALACAFGVASVLLIALAPPVAASARAAVARWTGIHIVVARRPIVPLTRMATGYWWNGYDYQRLRVVSLLMRWVRRRVSDAAAWRDMLWMLVSPFTVGLATGVPVAAFAFGIGMLLIAPSPAASVGGALLSGAALIALSVAWRTTAPVAARVFRLSMFTQLTERVAALVDARADLSRTQQDELHRIERDLHDGPQARLVAIGLAIGTAEYELERDPAAARSALRTARESAASALHELRGLVHGIVPPVLLERGLVDAVRALALDCVVPVRVQAAIARPIEAPIESALYFAAAELLANAVKHADASAIEIELVQTMDAVAITVADDGRGGAEKRAGSGLAGVARRIAAFDGMLKIVSPQGGPTCMTVTVPCA